MRRILSIAVAAGVVSGVMTGALTGGPKEASAQEIQLTGPLAGAPAVRKLRLYRQGRFEIAPAVSFSLLDEYRRTIIAGGRLQYNFADWIGIGVWGGYGVASLATSLTDQIDEQSPRNSRTQANVSPKQGGFDEQTSRMQWVAAPQVTFVPFRGKLAIFQKIFVDTDAYLHAGLAFAGLQERGDCGASGQKACIDPASFDLVSRTAIAPTFGLGLSFYMSQALSLGVEYRALPFSWNRAGFDSRGGGTNSKFPDNKVDSEDQTFKFNQMVTIAVGIHLPTSPKISE